MAYTVTVVTGWLRETLTGLFIATLSWLLWQTHVIHPHGHCLVTLRYAYSYQSSWPEASVSRLS